MSHNMSIYRRLNPRLLVQTGLGLSLLHWANMSNISLTQTTALQQSWKTYPKFAFYILAWKWQNRSACGRRNIIEKLFLHESWWIELNGFFFFFMLESRLVLNLKQNRSHLRNTMVPKVWLHIVMVILVAYKLFYMVLHTAHKTLKPWLDNQCKINTIHNLLVGVLLFKDI